MCNSRGGGECVDKCVVVGMSSNCVITVGDINVVVNV